MVVKKIVKKVATKKTAAKKPAKKGPTMVQATGDFCFWVNNGPVLSSLADLNRALKNMSDDQFKHHVGKGKNDFAMWVGGVLSEVRCGKQLQKVKTKKDAVKVVETALKQYA